MNVGGGTTGMKDDGLGYEARENCSSVVVVVLNWKATYSSKLCHITNYLLVVDVLVCFLG